MVAVIWHIFCECVLSQCREGKKEKEGNRQLKVEHCLLLQCYYCVYYKLHSLTIYKRGQLNNKINLKNFKIFRVLWWFFSWNGKFSIASGLNPSHRFKAVWVKWLQRGFIFYEGEIKRRSNYKSKVPIRLRSSIWILR